MIYENKSVWSDVKSRKPTLWLNPDRLADEEDVTNSLAPHELGVGRARDRFQYFEPLLAALFPELSGSGGVIDSPLLDADPIAEALGLQPEQGRLLVKADHELPVVGSIKARGGAHAVLEFAEGVALAEGVLNGSDWSDLDLDEAKAVFGRYSVCVGSTGNLGLSVGTFAARLGFSATVHMSAAAKLWKKKLLRQRGAKVVEHACDHEGALAAGRESARADARAYFIDDENSVSLLAGYATAGRRLRDQLSRAHIPVDKEHPLFVYIPCGVGGAPAGIALGLHQEFGKAVHCFFVQPVETPCFLIQMLSEKGCHPSVYDFGLSGKTEADGLAVPRASLLAFEVARPLIGGILTAEDQTFFQHLALAHDVQNLKLEPSAASGFSGPLALLAEGAEYLERWGVRSHMANATHVVWTTGGSMVPESEHERFLQEGRRVGSGVKTVRATD